MYQNPMAEYQRNQLLAQQAMIQGQLNQMNQMYQQQPAGRFPPVNAPQKDYIVKEICSVEEIKNTPPEPGMTILFLDVSSGSIYLKQFDMDTGKGKTFTYKPVDSDKIQDPIDIITEKLEQLEKKMEAMNDKSVSRTECETSDAGNDRTDGNAANGNDEKEKSSAFSKGSGNDRWKR